LRKFDFEKNLSVAIFWDGGSSRITEICFYKELPKYVVVS